MSSEQGRDWSEDSKPHKESQQAAKGETDVNSDRSAVNQNKLTVTHFFSSSLAVFIIQSLPVPAITDIAQV